MKKKFLMLFITAVTFVFLVDVLWADENKAQQEKGNAVCSTCHDDMEKVLSETHPPVKGNDLTACLKCHTSAMRGRAQANPFSVKMHKAHGGFLDCLYCHTWTPGESFGLIGLEENWGAPSDGEMDLLREIIVTLYDDEYTAKLHADRGVSCGSCHGEKVPLYDETVESSRCLSCHGPMEELVKKTRPEDFPDRNPHESHLGEVACAVCHKGHGPSKSYCLGCHTTFSMDIPGQGE